MNLKPKNPIKETRQSRRRHVMINNFNVECACAGDFFANFCDANLTILREKESLSGIVTVIGNSSTFYSVKIVSSTVA